MAMLNNQRVYPMFPDLEFVGMFSHEPWHPRHPSCSSLSNLGVQPWILPQNNQGEAQGARWRFAEGQAHFEIHIPSEVEMEGNHENLDRSQTAK